MRAAFVVAAVGVLASAAHADERPSFVPPPAAGEVRLDGNSLRAMFVEGAVECESYDAPSNTCEAISVYARRGDAIVSSGMGIISSDPDIRLAIEAPIYIEGDASCANANEMDVRILAPDLPAEAVKPMRDIMTSEMKKLVRICSVYIRSGDGFTTRAWRQNGEELDPLSKDVTRFIRPSEATPRLRALKPSGASES